MSRTSPEEHSALMAALDDAPVRELFSFRFLEATEIYDQLTDAAAWRVLSDAGALPEAEGTDPETLPAALHFPERTRPALRFCYAKLADSRYFTRDGDVFRPTTDRPGSVEALAEELSVKIPEAAVGAEIILELVAGAPSFFRGERTGEEILFAPNRLPLWFRYFSNENILYRINNTLGAEALSRALPARAADVLEIGGGCGSAAEAALKQIGSGIARYRFTELVPTFARRGERAARAAAFPDTVIEAAKLDMNRPWAEQGVAPGTFDAVYSVNCFHVAPDLGAVLVQAREALRPGGALVISECIRPTHGGRPIYVEFIFDFLESFTNVATDPVKRPNHGFLSPTAWRASLEAAGFEQVAFVPDVDAVAERYPNFFVGVAIARRPPHARTE
ncbi:MAG: class I SAM-dependent methyltransferase [Thermoanaerobaculia bacterium]